MGVLTVGDRSVTLTCAAGDNECILRTYLHLVAEQRAVPLDRSVVLRRDDVLVLAELLDLDDVRLEQKLATILRLSQPEAKALRRDLLRQRVTAAALGVGLVAGIPLSGVAGAGDATDSSAAAGSAGSVRAADPTGAADHTHHTMTVDVVAPATVAVTVELPPEAPVVTLPEAAPMTTPPPMAEPEPAPEAPPVDDVEIGYSVTYERDPDFVPPEGVEIGDAMVIERDLPDDPGS